MKRAITFLGLLAWLLTACGEAATPYPTPLPTAVPPIGGESTGGWAISFEYSFPQNSWAEGVHRYQFYVQCPVIDQNDFSSEWILFDVSEDAQRYDQPIYLRLSGMSTGILSPQNILIIHPDQPTTAIITFLGLTEDIARQASDCEGLIRWDDKNPVLLTPSDPFRP
jgi:hypothetical protein